MAQAAGERGCYYGPFFNLIVYLYDIGTPQAMAYRCGYFHVTNITHSSDILFQVVNFFTKKFAHKEKSCIFVWRPANERGGNCSEFPNN